MTGVRLVLAAAIAMAAWAKEPLRNESLSYSVNWPSGLSIGEIKLDAAKAELQWKFTLALDAAVSGFSADDKYQSVASASLCSSEFTKQCRRGKRKFTEKTVFDPKTGGAVRETLGGGGTSRITIPECPRDAVAFLYFLRRELAEGRLPGPQTVYFGAAYEVHVAFGGVETVRVNDEPAEADRVLVTYKGPASGSTIEMFFARDAARTPVLARIALPAGNFNIELIR